MASGVRLAVATVLVCALSVVGTEPVPCPKDLLRQVAENYAGLRSYEMVGSLTLEFEGWFTSRGAFRAWASYPRSRVEYEQMDPAPAPGVSFATSVLIADVATGRQFTRIGDGSWVEEELEQDWSELGMFHAYASGELAFTSLGEESRDGRPTWVLEGSVHVAGQEVPTRVWVDKESLWVWKTQAKGHGMTSVYEIHDFRPGAEVPAEKFLLPPGAEVIVRPPRSPEAEAIMERVWDEHQGLASFFVSKTESTDGRETEVVIWYKDTILRVERTSRIRIPGTDVTGIGPVSVTIWDFAGGGAYSTVAGRWEGVAMFPSDPGLRSFLALGQALGLGLGARYTVVEQDVVGDRPAWRITGEPQTVLDEIRVLRWWVDRETYAVLQYEEPTTAVVAGVIGKGVRTVRVERFEPDAEVPPEKLVVPEGVPIRWFGAPGPLATDDPGERAEQGVRWDPFSEEHLAEARAEGRPVLLYFTADWCLPCGDFEEGALHDKQVVEAAEPFVRLKVDLTSWGSSESIRLRSAYRVGGVPLTLIMGADGAEAGRVMGSVPAWVLLDALRAAGPIH